jgi:hypothetical protein
VAHYHVSIKTGGKGAAADHAAYIAREGRFADQERYGAVEAQGVGNMPAWARDDPAAFWRASDSFERENGNTYREFELALPRELERAHQIALVERFIESELGGKHAYQWALHADQARDGGEQPHVHVMFSDRMQDGIERAPEQYFKRANRKTPEKGGALKRSYGADKAQAAQTYREIRARWGAVQNLALEAQGIAARVDHRSLAAQGIHDREPGLHQGPAVAGIEARGERSAVGERQREQIAAREAKREAVLEEQRQLERAAQAALHEASPRQLPLFTRLLSQGRALQQRLVQTFERVKDWVRERFHPALTREEIQAGKAGFRAEYERHKAEQAARRQALEAGRERYNQQKAVELARQREIEQAATEQRERLKERERHKDMGGRSRDDERRNGRSPEDPPDPSRKKDHDHGMER